MMWLLLIVLSLALGSFANVLIHRLPLMINNEDDGLGLALPASHCPSCHTPLKFWHNIPLISFIALRRRCAFCGATIAWRYFVVELGALLLGVASVWLWGWTAAGLAHFVFLYILWALAWIDGLSYLLPDVLVYVLLWAGLLYRAIFAPHLLADAVFAAVLGYLVLYFIYWLFLQTTGRHGLGFGDMKLVAAIGVWLGLSALANVLIIACVLALVFALLRRRKLDGRILPFGPFLAGAAAIVLVTRFDVGLWLLEVF